VSVAIHGELTEAGDRIVLIAGGPVEDVAYAAKQLGALTPLIKASNPKGALLLPATWPAVVQLSATYGAAWRPGPRLLGWIREQAALRTSALAGHPHRADPRRADAAAVPGRGRPHDRPHRARPDHRRARHRQDHHHDARAAAARLRRRRGRELPYPILVVAPASVVDPWVEAYRQWAPY
jgi:hypothetical protein